MITAERDNEIVFVFAAEPDENRKAARQLAVLINDPRIAGKQRLQLKASLAGLDRHQHLHLDVAQSLSAEVAGLSESRQTQQRDLKIVAELNDDQAETVHRSGNGEPHSSADDVLAELRRQRVLHLLQHLQRVFHRL